MLAESRSRQKWSEDPQNTRWAKDTDKFGYQMLTKMGWTEGKGLGHKEDGALSHIRIQKRNSQAGVGMKKSRDDDWIAHQNDFNALLLQLNQGSSTKCGDKISSLEKQVKTSKKKILYTKFVKSKDLSNASSEDLACIFGQRSKPSTLNTNQVDDEDIEDSETTKTNSTSEEQNNTEHGVVTVHSGVNMSDYFAKKMAALKQNSSYFQNISKIEENKEEEEIEIKKLKKKKRKAFSAEEDHDSSDVADIKKKHKNKEQSVEERIETDIVKKVKKKKKKKVEDIEEKDNNTMNEEKNIITSSSLENQGNCKKKKKRKDKL